MPVRFVHPVVALALWGAALAAATGTWSIRQAEASSPSPHSRYTHALQNLRSVKRMEFAETVHVLVQGPTTVQEALRYAAPDSVETLTQSKHADGTVLTIESIQVGTVACQRPPSWNCYHHPKADIVSLIQSLVEPSLKVIRYTESDTTYASGKKRYPAIAIHVHGTQQSAVYDAVLTIDAATNLPLSFTSVVKSAGKVAARQSATFSYNGAFTIRLPHGKNVHLPKP